MGHEIFTGLLKATTREEAIRECQDKVDDILDRGYYDYGGDFFFYNKVFDTEEEAENYLYDQGEGICMVKNVQESSSIRKNKEKLQELYAKERNYDDNFRFQAKEKFKERSSSTCSCSECETRYKKEIALKFNLICPVCQNWMIPDGAKESYQKAKNRIKAQQATLEALIKDQIKKDAQNTSNIRYFYLLDFHH